MDTLTGHFEVSVFGVAESDVAELCERLRHFVQAIDLGMFPPAALLSSDSVRVSGESVRLAFQAKEVPVAAFTVLDGMLRYFSEVVGRLQAFEASRESDYDNLLNRSVELPTWPHPLPFSTELQIPGGTAPPLLVSTVFQADVPAQERTHLLEPLKVWKSLLLGGYPRAGDKKGESAAGPTSIRFNSPITLHFEADAWRASESCFTPLFNLLIRWHKRGRVVNLVSIE